MIISGFTVFGLLILGVWVCMSILAHIEESRKDGECMLSAFVNWFKPYKAEEKDPVPHKQVLMSLIEVNGQRMVEVSPNYVYSRGDKKLLVEKVEAGMEQKKRLAMIPGMRSILP